jgi:hypothetical protein
MNGTLFEEIQKKKENIKKEKIKFIITMISTNLFTAILCLSATSTPIKPISSPNSKKIHPNYKTVNIPLDVLSDYKETDVETPVSLVDKNHQIIAVKAYLHGQLKDGSKRFKIEILETDLLKLNAGSNESMIAIPEINESPKKIISQKQRISKYEIIL